MELINEKLSEEMKSRNFDKSIYYMQLAQELHTYESRLDKPLEGIKIEDKIDSKKELPNYEEYKAYDTIEHTLKEDFTHKRPCSFKLGELYINSK